MVRTSLFGAASFFCLLAGVVGAGEGALADARLPRQPAPGQENVPVVFWAHFMPQVAWGFLHAGGHVGGNADVFPFETQDGTAEERMYRAMKNALDSGINGFQFLTSVPKEAFPAAERVTKDTGKMFYIAPEWCDMGDDTEKAAKRIAGFVRTHRDNPRILNVGGKQLHFLYNHGKWSGTGGDHQSQKLPAAREIMKAMDVEVLLAPTAGDVLKVVLDRTDRTYRAFEPFVPAEPGAVEWLKQTNWDGATGLNSLANTRHAHVLAIKERLAALDKPFLFVPSMRTMYDSSNRYWQAIHCKGLGLRVLRRDLRLWIDEGFRLFTFSTWNDVNETMLMPSSRNVWGLNDLIRYYHELAATGKSPFNQPKFVVSYEPEVLLGDQGFFQFLVLPETGTASADYVADVSFRTPEGAEVATLGLLAQVDREDADVLAENRFDTTTIDTPHLVLVPYLTVRQLDKLSGAARVLYDGVRLPPLRIRYNKLHYYTPYTISLDRLATDGALDLAWDGEGDATVRRFVPGDLPSVRVASTGQAPYRRITLSESCLPLGTFRANDLPDAGDNLFLRLAADRPIRAQVAVNRGVVETVYRPHWDLAKALQSPGKPRANLDVPTDYRALPVVARLAGLAPDTRITVRLEGMNEPCLDTTPAELARTPFLKSLEADGKPIFVTIRLTTDATDANLDYPVPGTGTFARPLPLAAGHEKLRVFHAWGLTQDNRIRYANPVLAVTADPEPKRTVEFVRTGGVFDDFVNDSSSRAENPFTVADIRRREVPALLLPEFVLDLDEGGGGFANHHGTAHQLGWGWLEGEAQWIEDGWRGRALRLADGRLKLRSKVMPHGSLTVGMRVRFGENAPADRALFEDADNWQMKLSGPLTLSLDGDGRVTAWRPASGEGGRVVATAPLVKGWNHIVATYDLTHLRLYLNGQPAGVAEPGAPTYARTHSTPVLGASKVTGKKPGENKFRGEVDDLRILGYALTPGEVQQLYAGE